MTDKQIALLLSLVHQNFFKVYEELEQEFPSSQNQFGLTRVNPKLHSFYSELYELKEQIESLRETP